VAKPVGQKAILASTNDDRRPTYYVLAMFPYPSGASISGQLRNYRRRVLARFMRAKGLERDCTDGWTRSGCREKRRDRAQGRRQKPWTDDKPRTRCEEATPVDSGPPFVASTGAENRDLPIPPIQASAEKMFWIFCGQGCEREKRKITLGTRRHDRVANEQ